MFKPKWTLFAFLVIGLMVIVPLVDAQEPTQSEREAMYYKYLNFASYVKGGSIQPHWMADGSSFWYAEGAPANTVIYKIDPKANTKTSLFNTEQLRQALTPVLGHEPPYQGLPFEEFTFLDDSEKAVKFTLENKEFILQLDTYTITRAPSLSEEEKNQLVPRIVRTRLDEPPVIEVLSPNGQWFVGVNDHNLWLRSTYDGRSQPLTTDGVKDYEWVEKYGGGTRWAWWSPDSLKLAVKKEDSRKVLSVPVVHWLKPTVDVEWVHYPRAGGPVFQTELFVVDILSKRQVQVDIGEESDQYVQIAGWRPDGSELLFLRMDRLRKKLDLMAANPTTGSARVVLTEAQETFVIGFEFDLTDDFVLLEDGRRFVWSSERDGWNHLYLYDLDGTLIRRLTEGYYPVVRLDAVDEKAGWVYFTAHGDRQRPYDSHLYRVNLEGKRLMRLTEASGQHEIQLSPSRQFFMDTHSTVDRPPVMELKRADGKLLQTLSKANIDALKTHLKWNPPEEFVVKAADGETELYGVLYKPYDFDSNKKYPVIEHIYAGPQITVVPRIFASSWSVDGYFNARALVQLGFIVFMVDGRGTPGRGKEFQDVVYGNFGRHEIPDHVAALKHLAEERPYMDLSRVGIIGGSWGGYFAIRALLLAPEVYHVGIADAPDVDLYHDGPVTYEAYVGLPQDNKEGYEYGSNLRLAGNLKGKLLLVAGTSDAMVFSGTIKMVEALIRADKPYDLIVLPEQPHDYSGRSLAYFREAVRRYFQEHLKPEIGK